MELGLSFSKLFTASTLTDKLSSLDFRLSLCSSLIFLTQGLNELAKPKKSVYFTKQLFGT
ncbi:hypothetical protein [Spiroplasma endosymbiont of Lasioglossum malachurum]|uniref:hypothetical protein n=1 Tax=Spiroplasma endosymbiont of Lasioglossum malachurum TaxID=3066319 RepID=UPI0030CB9767